MTSVALACGAVEPPSPLAIDTASLPVAVKQVPYTTTLSAHGGTPPYRWELLSGELAPGIAVDGTTGEVHGAASALGIYTAELRVSDAGEQTAQKTFIFQVKDPEPEGPLVVTTLALPPATVGAPYTATLGATGGRPPYRWVELPAHLDAAPGALPSNLACDSTGTISGVPGYPAGTYRFGVIVVDAVGTSAAGDVELPAKAPSGLGVVDLSPPVVTVGQPFSAQLQASGGTPPYSWEPWVRNELESWLQVGVDGSLTGTPDTRQEVPGVPDILDVKVTDAVGATAFATLLFTVEPAPLQIPPLAFPDGTVGTAYEASLFHEGGSSPYGTWQLTAGTLPPGLAIFASEIDTFALIRGQPTTPGIYDFQLTVTSGGQSTSAPFTIAVRSPPLDIRTTSLPSGQLGIHYQVFLVAEGGTPPYTWNLDSGTLPDGLTLSSLGELVGSPTASGGAAFTVRVEDSSPGSLLQSATQALQVTIEP